MIDNTNKTVGVDYVAPVCKTVNFHVQSLLCISTDFEQFDEEEI